VQQPRIPIWVVGLWGSNKSMSRALKYDGLLPAVKNEAGEWKPVEPDDIRKMRNYANEQWGNDSLFDIIMEGETPGDNYEQAASIVRPFAEAGASWWNEAMWNETNAMFAGDIEKVLRRIRQGPPRFNLVP
jgi:hypothetical protein